MASFHRLLSLVINAVKYGQNLDELEAYVDGWRGQEMPNELRPPDGTLASPMMLQVLLHG